MAHTPTEEQQAVIDQARSPASLMLQAYAGCAKTSTIEMLARRTQVPALALAFNKRIADELRPRLPGSWQVKTLNGLGHSAWAQGLRGSVTNVQLDDRKLGKIVSQVGERQGIKRLLTDQWTQARELCAAAMLAGLSPGNEGEPLVEDTEDQWQALAIDQDIPLADFPLAYSLAREALIESIALARAGIISFDDQVYCPTILGGRWPRFPLVAVDESQDLSPLNHRQLALCSSDRIVSVGDSRQAIYAFRGADAASMTNLRRLRPSWQDLPLTLTFRCPKAVVARQQAHAPGFRASPGNAEGKFERADRFDEEDEGQAGWSWNWLGVEANDIAHTTPGRDPHLAILCRNNAPLLSLAFKLIRQSVPVAMPGRDLGKGLTQLAARLAKPEEPITKLLGALAEWEGSEQAKLVAQGREDRLESVTDRAECLRAVADGSQASRVSDLVAALDNLFARDRGRVTLSSIHRAKGLEWDLVLHLDPWRIPSKWSRAAAEKGDRRQLEQEYNLRYVCETRTRHTLINANLEDFR